MYHTLIAIVRMKRSIMKGREKKFRLIYLPFDVESARFHHYVISHVGDVDVGQFREERHVDRSNDSLHRRFQDVGGCQIWVVNGDRWRTAGDRSGRGWAGWHRWLSPVQVRVEGRRVTSIVPVRGTVPVRARIGGSIVPIRASSPPICLSGSSSSSSSSRSNIASLTGQLRSRHVTSHNVLPRGGRTLSNHPDDGVKGPGWHIDAVGRDSLEGRGRAVALPAVHIVER